MPRALSYVLSWRRGWRSNSSTLARGGRKRAELLSTEGGSAVGLRRVDRRELEPF